MRKEREAVELLNSAWPMARRRQTIKALADAAEDGNVKAATLLMNYAYGKPKEQHVITGADGESLMQPIADALAKAYGDGSEDS